ncbi:HEPN domain-containing protein [Candidatus Daviesbacteria bacterium]|nr:HEPN domain-containing protein [Candidatus Daviesbacteria bacterium]
MDKASGWLKLAEEDLKWAKASFEDKIFRGACFAAQQAAEKSLKAYLVSKDIVTPKIHDLVALNQKCIKQVKEFEHLEEACNILSPYYLSTRYPDVAQFEEYSEIQTKDVIEQAEKVVSFVKPLIPLSDP